MGGNLKRSRKGYMGLVLLLFILTLGCEGKTDLTGPLVTTSAEANAEEGNKLLEKLKAYHFFKGQVLIEEAQQWQSKFSDASHGEGDASFVVQELLIYDPGTQKAYIAVRSLQYDSQHTVTVNDPQGNYIGSQPVSAKGNLIECYGFGTEPGADSPQMLNLSALPLRIDKNSESLYTRPETINTQWVAYRSTADSVRWSIERIGPPAIAKDPQLAQLDKLDKFSNRKTYGNRESAIYEATRRLWQVKGSVDYQYHRIEAKEALDYLMDRLTALPEANNYVAPTALNQLAASALPQWEVMTALARSSYQAVGAGQLLSLYSEKLPGLIPSAVHQRYQQQYSDALTMLEQLIDNENAKEKSLSLLSFVEGRGFLDVFSAKLEALNIIQSEAPDKRLVSLQSYLQKYEETIQQLADTVTQPPSRSDQEKLLTELLKTAFESTNQQAIDITASMSLPADYPKAVLPLHKAGRLVIAEQIEEGGFTVTCIDASSKDTLVAYYTGILKKYQDFSSMALQDNTILSANQSPWSLTITIAPNQMTDEGGYMVNLILVPLE